MLCGQLPPIQKMDGNLGRLVRCEQLGISSNNIEKITGLKALKNLKILSIGRNCLKKFDGVGLLCISSVSLCLAMFFHTFPFVFFCPFLFFAVFSFTLSHLPALPVLFTAFFPSLPSYFHSISRPTQLFFHQARSNTKKILQIDFRITELRIITSYYTHKRVPTQRK